ncbi:Endonuclease/exonuclease/phosphatase [Mycena vitilis]|nr:Endonuclease/exonuclease/phosphatase [Mycena vitilis]
MLVLVLHTVAPLECRHRPAPRRRMRGPEMVRCGVVVSPLGLPAVACASRTKDGGLFLVPESKEATSTLVKEWVRWGPDIFPGARIIPPAIYSHIQLDGIPHAAGSVFIRLESRAKVDLAVSFGRLRLAGSTPTVVRGFPHLRVTLCWGCLKFGHIKAKCTKETKCGGCGELSHARKRVAETLRLRAVELSRFLNSTSSMLNLVQLSSWKSRRPLDLLTCDGDFDVICVQEPNSNEVLNSREHPNYALVYPDAFERHRVSVYIKLASIPAANICPRPDLAQSGDIVIIDLALGTAKITLINLYNDCVTRAGIELLRYVFSRLAPHSKILLVLDSNSHHPAWDLNTKTPLCAEDFELHDLVISFGLVLVTPPDVATHTSGNVIDLGFCSPSLFMAVDATVDPLLCVGSDHLPIH